MIQSVELAVPSSEGTVTDNDLDEFFRAIRGLTNILPLGLATGGFCEAMRCTCRDLIQSPYGKYICDRTVSKSTDETISKERTFITLDEGNGVFESSQESRRAIVQGDPAALGQSEVKVRRERQKMMITHYHVSRPFYFRN